MGSGLDILPGQFLPNVGGKVVSAASEISSQYAPGSFEKVMNQTGMSKEDVQFMINSQLMGTEEYHLKSVADSINQKSAKFKPKASTSINTSSSSRAEGSSTSLIEKASLESPIFSRTTAFIVKIIYSLYQDFHSPHHL